MTGAGSPLGGAPLAVLVVRGTPPSPADEQATAEAGGRALLVGQGVAAAGALLESARCCWYAETPAGSGLGHLAHAIAPLLTDVPLVVLPETPDGRDLAPRIAAVLGRPVLCGVAGAGTTPAGGVRAELSRLGGRILADVEVDGPAIATLVPGVRSAEPAARRDPPVELRLTEPAGPVADPQVLEVLEPDVATMDLQEAGRVFGAGAGLVPPPHDAARGRVIFALMGAVAARLGASAGATRVATDAHWTGHERQIGTTGVTIDPELYVALGVSGANQHTGGLDDPRHIISVNLDPACPMTAMADLGLIADAHALLLELAGRLGVPVPAEARGA